MAYEKTTWVDRVVQFANRFIKSNETSESVMLTADPGTVTEAGTPISAANMNKLEAAAEAANNELPPESLTVDRGLQVVTTEQTTPVRTVSIEGRHVINNVPLFDSGLWSLHANVTQDSPTKITLNASTVNQNSEIYVTASENTQYTLSLEHNGYIVVDSVDASMSQLERNVNFSTSQSFTFTTAVDTEYVRIVLSNNAETSGSFIFENIMLNEGSTAEGFVANLKPLAGLNVKRFGKNLLPPFHEWDLHANASVVSAYELELNATAVWQDNEIYIPVVENQEYTFSYSSNDYVISNVDENKSVISSWNSGGWLTSPFTSTTPSGAKYLRIRATSGPIGAGTFTFTNPMLNLGSIALPFVERNDDDFYLLRSLYGNGTVKDVVTQIGTEYWLTKHWEHVVLDGALDWYLNSDQSGYKFVNLNGFNANTRNPFGIKYNGLILQNDPAIGGKDSAFFSTTLDVLYVCIADTDSGWGESYTPSADEIKAYFMGWRMYDSSLPPTTTAYESSMYNGTGTKAWGYRDASSPNFVTSSGGYGIGGGTTTLPPTRVTNESVWKQDYQLTYQLAEPETVQLQEGVDYIGAVSLHEGDNQVELREAVVYREAVIPAYASGTSDYRFNSIFWGNELSFRIDEPLAVYVGGVEFVDYTVVGGTADSYGDVYFIIDEDFYNGTDPVEVSYIAQTYQLSAHAASSDVEYWNNVGSVVARNVQDIADIKRDLSSLNLDANNISFANDDFESKNVKDALIEVNDEKLSKAGDTMTGTLTVPSVIVDGVDLKQSVSDGKIDVRDAITDNGGTVADADADGIPTFAELATGVATIRRQASGTITGTDLNDDIIEVRGLAFQPSAVIVYVKIEYTTDAWAYIPVVNYVVPGVAGDTSTYITSVSSGTSVSMSLSDHADDVFYADGFRKYLRDSSTEPLLEARWIAFE